MLARIIVKKGMGDAYLKTDEAVEKTEEGMLLHNFDHDPDDQYKFV